LRTVLQLWGFFAPFKARIVLSVLLGFLTVGASIGLMATSGYLIASATLHPATILLLWVPIVGVRFFGLSRAVFRYLERYVSHDLTFRMLSRLRVWLYERIEPAAPVEGPNKQGGDVLSTLTGDVDTLQNFYLRVGSPPVVAVLTLVLVYALVSRWSTTMALVLAGLLLTAGVGVPLLTLQLARKDSRDTIRSRSQVYTNLTESMAGMTELIAFNQVDASLQELNSVQSRLTRQQLRLSQVSGVGIGLSTFLQNFAAWAMLWLAIPLVSGHQLTGVSMTAVVLTALASFEAITPLPAAFQSFGQTMEAARRVFKMAEKSSKELPSKVEPKGSAVNNARPFEDHSGTEISAVSAARPLPTSFDVSVRNLYFSYTLEFEGIQQTRSVFQDVSFELPHGKHIALVGQSGSGKSTLASLLVRLWEYKGSILFGGRELREYSTETVRNLISVVPQQPYLFHTTIAANLRIAKPDASLEELRQATQLAQLGNLIDHLPEGFETVIGEQGASLSGGERQRIALARSFLQSAPLLVLDEPTTGLDAVTEQKVMSAILTAAQNRSLILITHRLAGLESLDELFILQDGRLVERGTHAQLLSQGGVYHSMWELERQMIQ